MIKRLRVTVDGRPYDVTVEVPDDAEAVAPVPAVALPVQAAPVTPAPTPPAPSAASNSGPDDVPSPLAGRVIALVVKPGQDVKENDHLLTLEAMKMNTFVFAPRSGKVAEIKVAVGDAVAEGQSLAKIA